MLWMVGNHAFSAELERPWTLGFELAGRPTQGWPVHWSESAVQFLSPDGRLTTAKLADIAKAQKVADDFSIWTQADFRAALQQELRTELEVTGTGHYLVAHPPGQGGVWAKRFEEVYRSFVQQFSVRGLPCEEPRFPLVAIVFTSRGSFQHYAEQEGVSASPGLLGYYSPSTNRVALFDAAAGKADDANWQMNSGTIIHEATHQAAFNTGVHSRFAPPPHWVSEGLATLYEARGFSAPRLYSQPADRINGERLRDFRTYDACRRPGVVKMLVQSDQGFRENVLASYAAAWGLSYFLMEKYPREYVELLRKTGQLTALTPYSSAQRWADFTTIFGSDTSKLERDFFAFMAALPSG
jgi:hypothetical protein